MNDQLERLEQYRERFVKLDGMREELEVDADIAKLMTEMEKEFRIAQIASNNHVHPKVMEFYKMLSAARS